MSDVVTRIVNEGRDRLGGDKALSQAIAPLLGGFVYGPSAISTWGSGTFRPTAEAVFAIAKVSGVSIDALVLGKSMREELDEVRKRLARLEGTSTPND